ncbi:MAG: hypothetical protein IPM21_10310 [Acidobacteria bacterium]|nr:hypothetical protein [Acidobacteriota bacterium]
MKIFLRTKASVILLLLVAVVAAPAQLAVGKRNDRESKPSSKYFDAGRLLEDVKYLASDELEGRSPERPLIVKARDYVAKRMRNPASSPSGRNSNSCPAVGKRS